MSEEQTPDSEHTNPFKAATSDDVVSVWKAKDGWRWQRIAINGRIVSESGEAFQRHAYAFDSAQTYNPGCEIDG